MRLTRLEIVNFRGIHQASINLPIDSRVICIIGSGDSGKSTLLTAIEWVLWPSWNLVATDTDFHKCNTDCPIMVTATIAELPPALMKEDKFGLYLRDFARVAVGDEDDEPRDGGLVVLSVRITIDNTLEPKWEVVTSRRDPKTISQKDRRLLSFGVVGSDHEKDFVWGRNSILQRYSDSRDALRSAFTQAMRSAVASTQLSTLDEIVPTLTDISKEYGVSIAGRLHNRLIMQNGSYSSTVGVFEDRVPFSQRGLGSKRLLSIGMNINAFCDGTLVLVDEVETGLEPYRITTLMNEFRKEFRDSGQIIMTTHSRSVVCECNTSELAVACLSDGELRLSLLNSIQEIAADIQALVRAEPDSFLCRRVVVCEGKTEVGLLRAFDNYCAEHYHTRFAHHGVGFIPGGGGKNFYHLAELLRKCGYDVCVLMDSDIREDEKDKVELSRMGIEVFSWDTGYAIEEQVFLDVSTSCINALLQIAVESKSLGAVVETLNASFCDAESRPYYTDNEYVLVCPEISNEDRIRIGHIAKQKKVAWYKNTTQGEHIGNSVFSEFDSMKRECYFKTVLLNLWSWVIRNDT